MSGYYFRAEKMSVGYQGKPLIENIDIELERGEILTLIGPNGAGKSTVLKSIASQLSLIAGTVYINEQSLREISGAALSQKMAVVLTEKLRSEMMTCEDVVSIGRYPYTGVMGRLSDHDREVMERAMQMAHIEDLKDRYFNQISDGQKQRVLLARAICQEPKVLVMDEPTSYLDIRHKLELLQILLKLLKEQGVAAIVSLHEIELAKRIADTVICIKDGRAEQGRSPEEVFTEDSICRLFDISTEQYRWLGWTK